MEKNRSNNTGIHSGSAGARRPVNNTGNANARPANNAGNTNARPANNAGNTNARPVNNIGNTGARPVNNTGNASAKPMNTKAGAGKKGNTTGVVRTTTPRKARQIVKDQGMEKGKAKRLLDRLEDMVNEGQTSPFSNEKVTVNKVDVLEIIEDLRKTIDIELKHYHEVTDKSGRIIKDAKKDAEEIIVEAEQSASRIRMSKPNPIALQREVRNLPKQDKMALRTANEIYASAIIYTNEMLMEINETVRNAYNMISTETDRVLDSLRQKSEVIEKDKNELMEGLMDMKKQERYADILDISQLLANELYYEKNKIKEAEKREPVDDSEMVQWEFDFDERAENPIRVKASREPVRIPVSEEDKQEDSTVVDSAFQVANEILREKNKKGRAAISMDRTPVKLQEEITDEAVENMPLKARKRQKPEVRISGGDVSGDFDGPFDDGVVG